MLIYFLKSLSEPRGRWNLVIVAHQSTAMHWVTRPKVVPTLMTDSLIPRFFLILIPTPSTFVEKFNEGDV